MFLGLKDGILIKKLNLCCLKYDSSNLKENIADKYFKQKTLLELVDYVQYGVGTPTERVQGEIAKCLPQMFFVPCLQLAMKVQDWKNLTRKKKIPLWILHGHICR